MFVIQMSIPMGKFAIGVNIALPDLRNRLSEIPKDKEIYVHLPGRF